MEPLGRGGIFVFFFRPSDLVRFSSIWTYCFLTTNYCGFWVAFPLFFGDPTVATNKGEKDYEAENTGNKCHRF